MGRGAPGGTRPATPEAVIEELQRLIATDIEALNHYENLSACAEMNIAPCAYAALDIALWVES